MKSFILREITEEKFFYLCQNSNWQCVVEAEDELSAGTKVMENIMNDDKKRSIGSHTIIKKLQNDLSHPFDENEKKIFFTPMLLADAGFHNESVKLKEFLDQNNENN
jgi:hypothetical protein